MRVVLHQAKPLSLTLLTVAWLIAALNASANPTAPTVVSGTATFQRTGTQLQVTNSPNAIINWQSFSIGANDVTRFVQQSSASAVLNRVVNQTPTSITGMLQSNGRVFLVNPNGLLFGAGAQINTAAFVATTLNISDTAFAQGNYSFSNDGGAGSIQFQGATISTPSTGSISILAPAFGGASGTFTSGTISICNCTSATISANGSVVSATAAIVSNSIAPLIPAIVPAGSIAVSNGTSTGVSPIITVSDTAGGNAPGSNLETSNVVVTTNTPIGLLTGNVSIATGAITSGSSALSNSSGNLVVENTTITVASKGTTSIPSKSATAAFHQGAASVVVNLEKREPLF